MNSTAWLFRVGSEDGFDAISIAFSICKREKQTSEPDTGIQARNRRVVIKARGTASSIISTVGMVGLGILPAWGRGGDAGSRIKAAKQRAYLGFHNLVCRTPFVGGKKGRSFRREDVCSDCEAAITWAALMWKYSAFSKAVDVALKTHDSKRGTLVGRHLVIFLLLVVFSVSSDDISSGKKWSKKMGSSFGSSLLQFIRRSGKEESDMFFFWAD